MTLLLRRWRLMMVAAFVTFLALLAAPTIAFAQETAPVGIENAGSEFVITPVFWTIVTGVLLPFLVALITKLDGNPVVKGVVGIIVAAVAATVERATLVDGSALFDQALLLDIFLVYAPQLLTYLGLYSKFNNRQGIGASLAPNFGLG